MHCLCDCGSEKTVMLSNLTRGATTSCGCAQKEAARAANSTHGQTNAREYRAWMNMKARCFNPLNRSYPAYGGRGITVCKAWLESFDAFFADMGIAPPEKTLDRINVNGDYEPGNCRWASITEQANNTRVNRLVEIDGVTKTLKQWCDYKNLSYKAIHQRISRGKTPLQAITETA